MSYIKVRPLVCAVALLGFGILFLRPPDSRYTIAEAASATYGGSITGSSPTYVNGRPGGEANNCSVNSAISSANTVGYHAFTFQVDTTGVYRMVQDSNTFNSANPNDGLFFLYSASFNA